MKNIYKCGILLGLCLCEAGMTSPAKAQTPSPTCLMPMQPKEADPSPRDVSFAVSADKKLVTAFVCIVSNRDRFAALGASFGVFDNSGKLIGLSGEALGAVGPINDPTPNHPKIVSLSATNISINPALADQLLNKTLIQIQWAPCTNPTPDTCIQGAPQSDTFVRDVTFTRVGGTPIK